MAQAVSYGSITIVDTNDIEEIYMIYAGSNSSDSMPTFTYAAVTGGTIWKRDASQVTGNYIWQSTVVTKSGVDITSSNWTSFYGVPVCITGPGGADARKITSVVPYYYLSTSNTGQTGGSWNTTPPTYPSTGTSYYWTKTVTTYDSGSPTESTPVLDMALTNAAKDSRDANSAASQAVSIATDAQENSEGALSQSTTLDVKLKNFFWPGDSNYPGAYAVGKGTNDGLDAENISTYGYNLRLTPVTLSIGYNQFKAIEIDGSNPALKFYKPSKTTQGAQTAQLDANGLVLSEGGIEAGNAGQSGFIYLSTKNYGSNLTINGHQAPNWKEIIGTKFGVDADGNLYASNATISGAITATSLTIGSGASVSGLSTSNISGIGDYAKTSEVSSAINTATDDMATKTYVTNQGYQTATDVNGAINTATSSLATKDNAIYRTQQIYRRYTAAQSNLSGPTTWVTTSTNIYNNWTTKIPPLTSGTTKYPYLYTAIQTQTIKQYNGGSGTACTCTSVLLDDTTTIIDGGSIIAGSVTANEITGSKLSAIYADMGTITAGNITKGYNSINFDNTPATLEFKNASSWSTATQGIKYDSSGLAIKGAITVTSGSDLSAGLTNYSTTAQISNTYSTKADSVKRTQRIYYYASSEGEGEESTESETLSAPETPNDWISASSGVETWINQRIEEVPASSGSGTEPLSVENYPNVWVSEQTEMVNGHINCTPPKLDSISSIALDAQDLVNSLSDTINGENGLSETIRLLTGSIIINPGDFTQTPPVEPSITIQTNSEEEGAETGKAALTLTSTQLILEKNDDAVITLDSTQDDGAIEANEIILNSGLRIGNLEIIPYNGGIGIRAWEVEE